MYEKITGQCDDVCIRHYDNPHCEGEKEFQDLGLKRFKYIKRLLRKYYENDILKERLLINHIIVLSNVFGGQEKRATLLILNTKRTLVCTQGVLYLPKYT